MDEANYADRPEDVLGRKGGPASGELVIGAGSARTSVAHGIEHDGDAQDREQRCDKPLMLTMPVAPRPRIR